MEVPRDSSAKKEAPRGRSVVSRVKKEVPRDSSSKKEVPRDSSSKKEVPRDSSAKKEAPRAKKEAPRGSSAKKEASRGSSAKKEVPRDSSDKKEAQRDTSDKKEAPRDCSAKKEAPRGSSVKKSAKKYSPSPASPTHPSPPSSSLPRSLSPSHSPSTKPCPPSASHSPSSKKIHPPKGGNDESASFRAKSPDLVLNVLCWNIMGESAAIYNKERKRATTTTFQVLGPDANIICIQEMKFDPIPSGRATYKYLPDCIFKDYEQSKRKEDRSNTYNAIFFRKEIFQELEGFTEISNRAYELIDMKWRIYHEISEKGKDIKSQAKEETLAPFEGYQSEDEKRMRREIVKKYDTIFSSAYNVIKYRQQRR